MRVQETTGPPVHSTRARTTAKGTRRRLGDTRVTHSEAKDRVDCASRPFGRSKKGLTRTTEVLTRSLKFIEQLLSSEEIKNKNKTFYSLNCPFPDLRKRRVFLLSLASLQNFQCLRRNWQRSCLPSLGWIAHIFQTTKLIMGIADAWEEEIFVNVRSPFT